MIIKETRELTGFNTPKLPKLKGHVKVTLKNVHNRKTEVIEGSNIVTNAVRDILGANYLGAVDYSKIFGADGMWKKWYGGVLCYTNPHPTITVDNEEVLDPNNYYPQADNVNHLTAHAGQTAVDPNHDDDLRRGNPTTAAYVYSENSIKEIFEWGTTHGNGTISALSLTHTDTGDAGLGSDTYAFQQFQPFDIIDAIDTTKMTHSQYDYVLGQYDDAHAICMAIGEDGEWAEGHQAFESNKLTVYIRKFPFSKAGLYQTMNVDGTYQQKFTVTLPFNIYCMPCYYFDRANKRLWVFTNFTSASTYSKTAIKYAIIDCVNKNIYSSGTITSDTANIAPMGYGNNTQYYNSGMSVFFNVPFDGTYFYFPTGVNNGSGDYRERHTGYQKINFSNQSDQSTSTILSGAESNVLWGSIYGGGLIITPRGVSNGNTFYPCTSFIYPNNGHAYSNAYSFGFAHPNSPSSYAQVFDTLRIYNAYNDDWHWILANKMLNTTLFNLPTPITKSASQAMTVEYTLTEVE